MISKDNQFSLYKITYRNSYGCTYIHTITISEKTAYEFEGEQRGVYKKVGRKEQGGGNVFKL